MAISRVSIGSGAAGAQGLGASGTADLSADGRYVVFGSNANNLVAGDTNGVSDAFRRDTATGVTEIVSVNALGQPVGAPGLGSGFPTVSGDGQRVVFVSDAPNVVAGDTNGGRDVFLRDMADESTLRVSIANDGSEGGRSDNGVISSDGQTIAFGTLGLLVPTAVPSLGTTYAHVWSLTTEEMQVYFGAIPLRIGSASADGSLVALDDSDRIFVIDRAAGVVAPLFEFFGSGGSYVTPDLSADGNYVALAASRVAGGPTQIYVLDRSPGSTGSFVEASLGVGANANGAASDPSISADGRLVVFESLASNLVPGDTNSASDVFLFDRTTRTTVRLSVDANGNQLNGASYDPVISDNGQVVAFSSDATNAVTGDTNAATDVFRVSGGVTVRGTAASETLYGSHLNDTVIGDAGDDRLFGQDGNDTLTGSVGANLLVGGNGNDVINAGAGADTARGGAGLDTLNGEAGADVLFGGADNDALNGGTENDYANGGAGNDSVLGGDGDDLVLGGVGDDTIDGGIGNDRLRGQAGNDTLTGGAGADTFRFSGTAFGNDRIADYVAVDDSIQLIGTRTTANVALTAALLDTSGNGIVDDPDAAAALVSGSLVVTLLGGTITFTGVTGVAIGEFTIVG